MSGFGPTPKSSDQVPLGTVVVPGNITPRVLAGSLLAQTDANGNTLAGVVASNAIQEAILNGRGFTANYEVSSAPSSGWYVMSIFNPNASGKVGVFYSVKTLSNYGNGSAQVFPTSSDPNYSNAVSSINHDNSSAITSVFNATAQSASVSPPSFTTRWDYCPYSTSSNEVLSNGAIYRIAQNKGIAFYVYTTSSQEYALQIKWIEI
jgi:hypothetical protein